MSGVKSPYFIWTLVVVLLISPLLTATGAYASVDGRTVLSRTSGDVRLLARSGGQVEAKEGAELSDGDQILTGKASFADVRFPSGEIVRVASDSILKINRSTQNGVDVGLTKGGLFGVISKYRDAEGAFTVTTPTATAGVRGTVFYTGFFDCEMEELEECGIVKLMENAKEQAIGDMPSDTIQKVAEAFKKRFTKVVVKNGKMAVTNPSVDPSIEVMVDGGKKTYSVSDREPYEPMDMTPADFALFAFIDDLLELDGAEDEVKTESGGGNRGLMLALGGAVVAGAAVGAGGGGGGGGGEDHHDDGNGDSGTPDTGASSWGVYVGCAGQASAAEFQVDIPDAGGSFSSTGYGIDYTGAQLTVNLSGYYDASGSSLSGTLSLNAGECSRSASFNTSFSGTDTGYVTATNSQGVECSGCTTQIRFIKY